MIWIAHIINPVDVGVSSDLFIAQPITFETMRVAREFEYIETDATKILFLGDSFTWGASAEPNY
jgi:hypothetical protein